MTKFKVGDRVRFKNNSWSFAGQTGTVVRVVLSVFPYDVDVDDNDDAANYPTADKEIDYAD